VRRARRIALRGVAAGLAAFALAAALALVAAGCGLPEPEPLPRILGASPQGEGIPTSTAAEIRFGAPVDPAGLADGRLLVLAPPEALRAALAAVEGEAGAAGLAGAVAADVAVDAGGARVVLRPRAPLRAFTPYAVVLSSRVRAADGRPMLDPEGRRRTFVASFETGAADGPPPAPALTEVRADAATPETGGEYVEVLNLGPAALDLAGWRLAKRTSSGTLQSCAVAPPPGVLVPPGGVTLLAGGAWDRRYAVPEGVPVLPCGASALAGGLANDRAPELLLADPGGAVRATFGAGGAPVCPIAAEKLDPAGPDEAANIACTEGTPGALP
jgi:hypothetical protein